MRLLQISPEAPGDKSGGQIGVAQTIKSIAPNNIVDYIGPIIEDEKYVSFYNECHYLQRNDKFIYKLIDLFKGITSTYYRSWVSLSREFDFDKYDAVILDFTKLDFCLNKLNKSYLITRVHNCEGDYAKEDYKTHKTIKNFLVYITAGRSEKKLLLKSNVLVFLHDGDIARVSSKYHMQLDKSTIVPVCVDSHTSTMVYENSKRINLLITGSLWFGANYEGILWILDKVLPLVKCDYKLMIAGNRPTKELISICEENESICLIDSPESMDEYFKEADIVLAPIFNGAGMKVKIAEAFSYGIPVIGTHYSFNGYSISDGENSFLADDEQSFANAIDSFSRYGSEERKQVSERVRTLYEESYSTRKSIALWESILGKVR